MDTQLKLFGRQTPSAEPIKHLKPIVDPATLHHRHLLDGAFWQRIPAYRLIDEATFLDHTWQAKNSITNPQKLLQAVQDLVPHELLRRRHPRGFIARRCRSGCRRICCR